MTNLLLVFFILINILPQSAFAATATNPAMMTRDVYLKYFEEVYKKMDDHYYYEVNRTDFDHFVDIFDHKVYPNLLIEGKSPDYVRWRGAAYLVDYLKQPDDKFSRFLPPKPAEQFAKDVYGQKIDLGIEGHLEASGFVVDFVEPRSDAYAKGLRETDLIVNIDAQPVEGLLEKTIKEKLNPLAGTKVKIDFLQAASRKPYSLEAESKEYFKQTVFLKPTGISDVYCLQIQKFNQGTPDDMSRFVTLLAPKSPKGIVIDLRDNPGGPPLAARAISAFFLPNGEELVYFEGRRKPRSALDIPVLPPQFRFDWPMVILVNKDTGSASELFSGVMQNRKRATIVGEPTAGQVLLKSLFDMSDGSSMALMVARGHFPDGTPFPFDGVRPDAPVSDQPPEGMVTLAAKYLILKEQGKFK